MEDKSPRDEALLSQGWRRRFSAGEPRLSEAAASYRELGLEVLLEPVDAEDPDRCTACLEREASAVRVIYTRPADRN